MRPSMFNVRVPLPSGEVFLMNTLSDAQMLVSRDVVALLDRMAAGGETRRDADQDEAVELLAENGFLVADRHADLQRLEEQFAGFHADSSQLRVTILTTLQCNFACEYCYQGDGAEGQMSGGRMSAATAAQVSEWIGRQIERVGPERLVLTFFGGEPLLNTPVMFDIAEQCHRIAQAHGIRLILNLITNGLLLSTEIVDRLIPLGLTGVKVTLDGDRETHDRARPMRGGQGTFDRIIERVRQVSPRVPVAIGGNFDAAAVDRFPALLDFIAAQDFRQRISTVTFKPVIRTTEPESAQALPLVAGPGAPAPRACGSPGGGGGSVCDSCHLADDALAFLRKETVRRGLPTSDGVHLGPCELYRRHSYTIGPDGSLFACPGFTGSQSLAVGHIANGSPAPRAGFSPADPEAPWRRCGDCAFIPVCGGGCAVAARAELGDMHAPACHKRSLEAALISLAESAATLS
jgi:uncharacterized protein